ncbi:uncharacterized protein LOC121810539 [Salvia splendens]|uniref:uncharacterized protein LOC121810539 n=1 Tax=Salvia splendens TaxID=180675 RepID=UPI001C258E96|nr:uncharacterized protein LOC121810539 [Salvia splendens]
MKITCMSKRIRSLQHIHQGINPSPNKLPFLSKILFRFEFPQIRIPVRKKASLPLTASLSSLDFSGCDDASDSGCSSWLQAPPTSKQSPILLDDVKISEQLIDLVFYLLVLLGPYRHVSIHFLEILDLYSVVCRYVLTTSDPGISHHTQWYGSSSFGSDSLYCKIVSPHYQEVAQALTAYYKVDIFIEAEFAAVCVDVKFLQTNDSFGSAFPTTEETLSHLCQSLLHLCEAESVSYLEEVASKTSTQDVAKSVGLKVLALLKKMFNAPSEASYPKGQLELNAMRLADVLSDDSNFLSFIMINFMRRICQQARSVLMEGLSETVRWILLCF